jgi:hypothetical protein
MKRSWILFWPGWSAVANNITESRVGEMNTFGEIFGAWLLFIMLGALCGVLYYFTIVRQPPKPILEEYTRKVSIPPHVWEKMESLGQKGKAKAYDLIVERPYLGRIIRESLSYGTMNPLKHDVKEDSAVKNSITIDTVETDNSVDMIIGAPLDDGESNLGSPRPQSPSQ